MNETAAKKRIESLRREIAGHNKAYYVDDSPEISDFAYDALMNELKNLEEAFPQFADADSPTQKVGGEALPSFAPVHHPQPLLSLEMPSRGTISPPLLPDCSGPV